jgi:hypothetical protein
VTQFWITYWSQVASTSPGGQSTISTPAGAAARNSSCVSSAPPFMSEVSASQPILMSHGSPRLFASIRSTLAWALDAFGHDKVAMSGESSNQVGCRRCFNLLMLPP